MKKKWFYRAMAAVLSAAVYCTAFSLPAFAADARNAGYRAEQAASAAKSDALFLSSVTLEKTEGNYTISYGFDKSVATEEKDITASAAKFFVVNGTPLSDVSGAKVCYRQSENGMIVSAIVPVSAGLVKEDGKDRLYVLGGFLCDNGYVTTVRYIYRFASSLGKGERIYRSDNIDDYAEVSVTSVSVPEIQGSNFVVYIYFSDTITPKKYIDLQVRDWKSLLVYHGDKGDKQYSDSELTLLYRYQIYSKEWENSLSYNLWFGCQSFNGLEAFPGNNGGAKYDMTPQGNEDGIDLYNVYQIQEQVADSTVCYYTDAAHTAAEQNNGSLQPLAVQIHIEGNHIQLVLKGDSVRDQILASNVYDSLGKDTGKTSFNENIAPDRREKMAISLRGGLLFPNGKILKNDFSFVYHPTNKQWRPAGSGETGFTEDETLSNQEGYTDEELAARKNAGR